MPTKTKQSPSRTESLEQKDRAMLLVAAFLLIAAITILCTTIIWQRMQMIDLLERNTAIAEELIKAQSH